MSDPKKNRKQLLDEIAFLRARLERLEDAEGRWKRSEEALRESERDKSLILGSLSELITYQDNSLKVVWANKAAGDSVGQSPEELVGRYCYEIWHGRKKPCRDCPVAKSIESGRPQEGEITSPDGRIWYTRGCPVLNEQGKVMGAVEVTLEITQRKRAEDALRENETLLQTVIDSTKDAMISIGDDGLITLFNPAAEEMFGRTSEEMIGESVDCLMPREYRQQHCEYVKSYFATGKPDEAIDKVMELPGLRSDGKVFPMAISLSPGRVDGKQFVIAVARDITERKQAEEQLQIRDKAIESSISAIAIAEPGGNLIYVNSAFLKMWGYDDFKEVVGRGAIEFWQHKDKAVEAMELSRVEGSWKGELTGRGKNGREFEVQVLANRVKGKAGKPDYMMASFIDITERMKVEETLRKSEEKYRTLFEDAGDALFTMKVTEEGACFLDCNDHTLKLFGCTHRDQIIGKTPVDFSPPTQPDGQSSIEKVFKLATVVMEGHPQRFEWKHNRLDGTPFWVEVALSQIELKGEPFMQAIVHDITERKRIEQDLAAYHEKMFRAEQLASLGMVSATIAHELNQPLTVIKLFLQQGLRALKDANDINKVEEVIDDCLAEVTKAASTVDRFRRFARKAAPIYVTEVDLVEVAERVVGLLTEGARRSKLNLSVNVESRPPHIIGNSVELEQMFFVLIQNAIQAADGQTQRDMTITISTQAGHVQLTFADTCGGIEHENMDRIFEPFFTTKPPNIGTGLGLCILERIVKRHGGSVRVENQEGHGTIFYIGLPIKN